MLGLTDGAARARLKELDQCLDALESAAERGETHVSSALARNVATVCGISEGTALRDALDLVFRAQARCLGPQKALGGLREGFREGAASAAGEIQVLSREEAAELTRRIKSSFRQLGVLLLEAHDKHAWSALGYLSWERYVRAEFGLGRSRSYQLLDQGRVIRAIGEAVASDELPPISPYAASQIKPVLAEVLNEIRDRTAAAPRDSIAKIVANVVQATRSAVASRPSSAPAKLALVTADDAVEDGHGATSVNSRHFVEVIDYLATRPPASVFVEGLVDVYVDQARLRRAISWLTTVADTHAASQRPARAGTA